MGFDIASLDTSARSNAGVDMTIMHPRTKAPIIDPDTGKAMVVTLYGRNGDRFRKAQREAQARRSQFASRSIAMTDEDFERERQDMLCACTAGWSFETMDGQPFPFTPENVRRLWADRRWSWLANDAFSFLMEEGNFLAL